jgi:hypothetical protein
MCFHGGFVYFFGYPLRNRCLGFCVQKAYSVLWKWTAYASVVSMGAALRHLLQDSRTMEARVRCV